MFEYEGNVAVVTGAASGIGKALALKFASLGCRLVLADVDEQRLSETAAECGGTDVMTQRVDVSDAAAVQLLADEAYDRFGAVHLLCNNAGIVPSGRTRPIWEFPLEDWQWAMGVNLMGIVHGIRSFVPRMIDAGCSSHIVNTISVSGLISGASSPVYGASKHAAMRATEALYASLEERGLPIGVTALCPGVVHTDIFKSERTRPTALVPQSGAAREEASTEEWYATMQQHGLAPAEVADMVVDAINARQFYLVTTSSFDGAIRDRVEDILDRRNPRPTDHIALSSGEIASRGEDR